MATIKDLKINIYEDKTPDKESKMKYSFGRKEHTIGELCSHPFYGETKVRFQNKTFKLAKACQQHDKIVKLIKVKPKASEVALELVDAIEQSIYKKSRSFVNAWYDVPEHKIDLVNAPITNNQVVVAFCKTNGDAFRKSYSEYTTVGFAPVFLEEGVSLHNMSYSEIESVREEKCYTEEHIIASNQKLKFEAMSYSLPWLANVLKLAKVFGITPNWFVGYRFGSYGDRGLCLTLHDAEELRNIVNWYVGQAKLGNDLSDKMTLDHDNGVDSITITRYEYYIHADKYTAYHDAENLKDFLTPLHASEEEKIEDILDDEE